MPLYAPPSRNDIAGTPSNATAKAGFGALWDYVTSLLGLTGDPADARTALGAASTAQGALADSALQPSDIGSTVQAYDAATAFTDTAQNFTAPQRATLTTDNDLSFDLSAKQAFKATPTAGGTLTFTNIPDGLPVSLLLVNGSNYAIAAAATTKISATDLGKISATGTYLLSGLSDGTNVYLVASESLA